MKIAVCGCGDFGKQAIKRINKDEIELVGVIDNYVETYGNYKLWNIENFCREKIKVDCIVVAMKWLRDIMGIIKPLLDAGYHVKYIPNYYWQYNISYCMDIRFIEKSCGLLADSSIEYIEMHVQDDCNLNCKCCSHFAPLFERGSVVDFQIFCQDIKRMKEVCKSIVMMRLLGGEPFLNKNLDLYIKEARKNFPYSDIRVCTNGLLMTKLEKKVINAIKDNYIVVDISPYWPTIKMKRNIEDFADENGICVNFIGDIYDKFQYCFSKQANNNMSPCVIKCINIYMGKFARCPQLMFISKYNEYFEEKYPESGIYDLYDKSLNAKTFVDLCSKNVPLCNYCMCKEDFFLRDEYMISWQCFGNNKMLADDWLWRQ